MGSLGGAEANAFITAGELAGRGWTTGLALRAESGRGMEAWRDRFPARWKVDDAKAARRALEEFQPDVIYVHKWDDLDSLETFLASGVPCVRMVHDHDVYCMRSYRYHPVTRAICTRAASWYCVFGCLAFVKRSREGFPLRYVSYPAKRREIELNRRFRHHFVVTPFMRGELEKNGIRSEDILIFPPVPRAGEPLQSDFGPRNLLLYMGQIIRGKGVDVMIEALAKVRGEFECIILGDGHHLPYCKELAAKLGLEKRVRFAGFIPQEELRAYCAEATAVLIPSLWPEPIATVGLEVMRHGLPVIAFDAGGIKDWLTDGENGRLIPWMDRDAFAAAVDDLLADKEKARRFGERGRELVARDYDFDEYIARMDTHFRSLLP